MIIPESITPTATVTSDKDMDFFEDMRRMLDKCDPETNKHDRLTILIIACINYGFDTQSKIFKTAIRLNFHRGHIAKILKLHTGSYPTAHYWSLGSDKRYTVLPDVS